MSYRITETTDHHHLGRTIPAIPKPGETLDLGDCEIRVDRIVLEGKSLVVSNPNYIIHAVQE